jgi:hypothetical protein
VDRLELRREHRQRLAADHRVGAIQARALLLHLAGVSESNAMHARGDRCPVAPRQEPGLRLGVGAGVERISIAGRGALRGCVGDPGLAGAQLVRMQLDRRHRHPHAHLDVDATLE